MRALIRTGSSKTLAFTADFPEPTQEEFSDHYIIRTKTTALTRGELTWPEPQIPEIPIPGFDLAGIIEHAPARSTHDTKSFKPGDEVYALSTFSWQGNAKEITVATNEELALKPKNMSWEEAASVPLSALSAWQAFFVHANLQPPASSSISANKGTRVLVTAASGSVGIWGVQLAHLAGVEEVVATCGPSNVDFVKSLGADTVLDYRNVSILDWVNEDKETRGFDVILDCIGGQTLTDVWKCARKGGKVISVAEPPDSKRPVDGLAEGVGSTWFVVTANGKQLAEITELIEQGKVVGEVDSVYALEEYEKAFERLEGGHARGKVVLKIA